MRRADGACGNIDFLTSPLPDGTRVVYYEAAAVIVTHILLVRFLEARAKGRTGQAIAKLVRLRPSGEIAVDRIMIGGEPVLVEKMVQAHVVGGTVNGKGVLTLRATAPGTIL